MLTPEIVPAAFTAAECDRILALSETAPRREARLVGQQRDPGQRRATLAWLDEAEGAAWVGDRIADLVRDANRRAFGFDLTEFAESAQVAQYPATIGGHFDWHADIGDGPVARRRKLTLVIQLSEPETYEGGALEIMPSAHIVTAPRARGSAVLFPSFLLHRVTPVTEGARASLTQWVHGPAFR